MEADDPGDDASSSGQPKGDLASRLKERGMDLPSEMPSLTSLGGNGSTRLLLRRGDPIAPISSTSSTSAPVHAALSVSDAEKKRLFTPLSEQGVGAVEQEKKRREAGERDLLQEVRITLKKWVQDCMARDEKRQKLREKGWLKCRVQATFSEGLHEMMKELIARYGGALCADSEKDKDNKATPSWIVRKEKWVVGFDPAAFETFIEAHPEVIDMPESQIRTFVEKFVWDADADNIKIRDLYTALEGKFGPMPQSLKNRVKPMAAEVVGQKIKAESKQKGKKPNEKDGPAAKRQKTAGGPPSRLQNTADVHWMKDILAPLGLREDGGGPFVRCPTSLVGPLLQELKSLRTMEEFHEILKSTQIGKVVNSYRHHPSPKISQEAKELVAGWRDAATSRHHKTNGLAGKGPEVGAK